MTKDPAFCLTGDTVDKAATLMKQEDVGAIPVIDSPLSKRLMGIVTDRDLALNIVAESRDARSVKIEEVMTRNPVTCREGDDVSTAMSAMADHQIRDPGSRSAKPNGRHHCASRSGNTDGQAPKDGGSP